MIDKIRTWHQLVEQIEYNFLYQWVCLPVCVGLDIDESVYEQTIFTQNFNHMLSNKMAGHFVAGAWNCYHVRTLAMTNISAWIAHH
ncbi:hypothetical protein BCL69_102933 [Nitrosomonas communis]|uniref:Uncharacterized protein n=2 Tax=Nitrosomonas communis TaxID=44574 RepID=A0A0F7KDD7_9PROT|nr:hypothetical protein AAW31_01495 [Nitrosomonas communis]TYP86699.1 hypothetical protein BCL69_102933 [Nitrosomonas communis]